jgi:hypothetical protein
MGHGCTNYVVFGVKGLGGIEGVWGLDRKFEAGIDSEYTTPKH